MGQWIIKKKDLQNYELKQNKKPFSYCKLIKLGYFVIVTESGLRDSHTLSSQITLQVQDCQLETPGDLGEEIRHALQDFFFSSFLLKHEGTHPSL